MHKNNKMNTLAIKIKTNSKPHKFLIELDAEKFERLAANFGFFNPDFLESLNRAEKNYSTGKIKKIGSLKELK